MFKYLQTRDKTSKYQTEIGSKLIHLEFNFASWGNPSLYLNLSICICTHWMEHLCVGDLNWYGGIVICFLVWMYHNIVTSSYQWWIQWSTAFPRSTLVWPGWIWISKISLWLGQQKQEDCPDTSSRNNISIQITWLIQATMRKLLIILGPNHLNYINLERLFL